MTVDSHTGLDEFDALVDLAVQRILLSDDVAATKFRSGAPVEDLLRERRLLAEADRRAVKMGLDREMAVRFLRSQMSASKTVQWGLLARWQEHPEEAPPTVPDLQVLRERLDELTEQLLEHLRYMQGQGHVTLRRRLEEVRIPVAAVHHLDPLHRRALDLATEWACAAE